MKKGERIPDRILYTRIRKEKKNFKKKSHSGEKKGLFGERTLTAKTQL